MTGSICRECGAPYEITYDLSQPCLCEWRIQHFKNVKELQDIDSRIQTENETIRKADQAKRRLVRIRQQRAALVRRMKETTK